MVFRSSDIQLAAYLLATGHPLVGVEGAPGRRVFALADVTEADRLAYFQDTHPVSARRLFGAYRDLKKVVFEIP